MRLEDQRVLRDPDQAPPVVLVPATANRPAVIAPAPPSDLIALLRDPEARVRRRAALAIGRVGLPEGANPVSGLLADSDPEVRQMAAFALGLIGDPASRPALIDALADPSALVQGRAAEALGRIGAAEDAAAIAAMVFAHVQAGALTSVQPDDLSYPLGDPTEAIRLGVYALARLGDYEALASVVLGRDGLPVSRWWPVAFALQAVGDPRTEPTLRTLLSTPGRYTAGFAARGLGALRAGGAVDDLLRIVRAEGTDPAVVAESVRALTAIADPRAGAPLLALSADPEGPMWLRVAALEGVGAVGAPEAIDVLLDLLSDRAPALRSASFAALGQVSPETLLSALSGLDPDPDWTVRAAQAAALGHLPERQARPRLSEMLNDQDQRVVPYVLRSLVALGTPGMEAVLLNRLRADDMVVRATAAAGLGTLRAGSAVGPLTEAYREWSRDPGPMTRVAAIEAVARLDPSAAHAVLQDALRDRDWAVRVRAAALLAAPGGEEAAGLARPADPAVPGAIRPAPPGRVIPDDEWTWLMAPPYSPRVSIDTDRGTIELAMAVLDAPQTVASFLDLAERGFFTGVPVHQVVPDFGVLAGDPRGDGEGGPGYTIRDEINEHPVGRGTVGMATAWPDAGGSQFFIARSPQPQLDGRYTVFGQVVSGLDVVDRLQPRDRILGMTVSGGPPRGGASGGQ